MNDLFKALILDKQVSLSVLDTTGLVNRAIEIHSLRGGEAVLMGNLLTCCAYMSGCLKSGRGAVSITVKGAECEGSASVSGDINLHIRGCINGSCRRTLKGGTLTVIKDDGFFRPFVGTCPVESDDVSEMMTAYFRESEQIPTMVSVGVNLGDDGRCSAAGGVVMQLLPGTSEENAAKARELMREFSRPADVLSSLGAQGIVRSYFGGLMDEKGLYLLHPDYVCNCSREKIESVIMAVGKDELLSVCNERGNVSVHCHYCNTDYTFDKEDILKLFDK